MSTSSSPTRARRRPRRGPQSVASRNHTQDALAPESNASAIGAGLGSGSTQTCRFHARGHCRYGDQCKQRHDARPTIATAISHPVSLSADNSERQSLDSPKFPSRSKPCFAWRKGSCAKGDQCRYTHDLGEAPRTNVASQSPAEIWNNPPQVNTAARQRTEQSAKEVRAQEIKRKADRDRQRTQELAKLREAAAQKKITELEANRRADEKARALEQLKQATMAEKHRSDALFTIQCIPFGSTIVTFGAGAQIVAAVTGFETCRVTISNIPFGVQMTQLRGFVQEHLSGTGEGVKEKFYVVSLKRWNQSQEGLVLAEAEVAKDLVRRLNGVIFRGQSLKIDLNENGGGVGSMRVRNWGALSLKVSWRDPTSRYVVTYLSQGIAEEQKRRFDGAQAFGRKVKVEYNTIRYGGINPVQILISDLPCEVTDDSVRSFFNGMTARRVSGQGFTYTESNARSQLKEHIQWLCNTRSITHPDFDEPRRQTGTTAHAVEHTVYVRFDRWDSARQIHDLLKDQRFPWVGNTFLRVWLPNPIQYEITIPLNQYQAQHARWKSLLIDTECKKDVRLRIVEKPEREKVFVQVEGNDAKAVGMLKVRVENFVAGEKISLWHGSFRTDSGRSFLRDLLQLTEVLVIPDWRLKVVKAYGEPAAIGKARDAILQEIDRLANLDYTVTLSRDSVRFFAQQGIASLKERFGEDSVTLNISGSPRITVRGGEDAQHALHSLIEQSRTKILPFGNEGSSSSYCPICLDEVSVPVQLGCGHEYCSACLHHFFTAEVKSFPIVCLGDEVRCKKPIALPIIQQFLTEVQFNALLETAFVQHVEKNPEVFRYCPTPDCEQLYRYADSGLSDRDSTACCPSCLSEICTRCHEGHEGMTCDERQRARNDQENNEELNARWAVMAGVKRCPKCNVWIEKTEGCNHISCRCGVHICWRCMGIFEPGTIYQHMTTAHGGYGVGDVAIRNDDYDAQARELQAWNNLAAARQNAPRPAFLLDLERDNRLRAVAIAWQEDQRRANIHIQNQNELRRQQQEQRIRDLEATQRRARQEEGGNWCTIM
ncbi:hypothetical protein GGU10DRAFT_313189 [Lentinula aff. detonsa]|uniref:RBR-type E3 ubiquitin transferase n=1 Tax=Lentinula aff. detonsa TaxID=2804958 RepID=A0AA38KG76_9AGAR|nr:hypothetical protein GGU10DRAFT_313189 [Lentinula aff. detonsa]